MMPGALIPYTCSVCRGVTYAPPRLIAVTCTKCHVLDVGTEIARQRWRTVAEIISNTPTSVIRRREWPRLVGYALLAAAVAFTVVLVVLAIVVTLVTLVTL